MRKGVSIRILDEVSRVSIDRKELQQDLAQKRGRNDCNDSFITRERLKVKGLMYAERYSYKL